MRRRLILGFVTVALALGLALAVPLGALFAHYAREEASDQAEDRATTIAVEYSQSIDSGKDETFAPTVGPEWTVSVLDRTGTLVSGEPPPAEARQIVDSTLHGGTRAAHATLGDRSYVAVASGTATNVEGVVVMSRTTESVERSVRNGWLLLAALGIGGVAVSALIASRLAAWISRPLDELRLASAAFGSTDLTARVRDREWPPDLQQLGGTFNGMAERIERLVAQNEAFVHEASHQLRTPLTGLRLRLENLTEAPGAAPETLAGLDAATGEVARLSRLTDGLLALARAERHTGRPSAPLDLVPFLEERLAQWSPLSDEYGIELTLDPVVPSTAGSSERIAARRGLRVLADEDRLSQVVDNLVANALDASEPGTRVRIRALPEPNDPRRVRVEVIDQGRGMTDAERDRAFERFWRSDEAGAGSLGGTGLGLPIVARLLSQDHASIHLEAGPDGVGTAAVMSFASA